MSSKLATQPFIPYEMWILILERCDVITLMNCYQVCKCFQRICRINIKKSFTPVLCRYWERKVEKSFEIVNKYFPNHTTPVWAREWFIKEEREDTFCVTYRKGQIPDRRKLFRYL